MEQTAAVTEKCRQENLPHYLSVQGLTVRLNNGVLSETRLVSAQDGL